MPRRSPITGMTWDGTATRAQEIDAWARDPSYRPRFQYSATTREARVLLEPEGQSPSWEIVPLGASLRRANPADADSPLILEHLKEDA